MQYSVYPYDYNSDVLHHLYILESTHYRSTNTFHPPEFVNLLERHCFQAETPKLEMLLDDLVHIVSILHSGEHTSLLHSPPKYFLLDTMMNLIPNQILQIGSNIYNST